MEMDTEVYKYKGNEIELFTYETELGTRWTWQFYGGPQGYSSCLGSVPNKKLALDQAQGLIDEAIRISVEG